MSGLFIRVTQKKPTKLQVSQTLTPGGCLADENTVTEAIARAVHVLMPVSECVQYHPSQLFLCRNLSFMSSVVSYNSAA